MKRICSALLFLACSAANAQFVTGQILTAAQLNAAFANVLSLSGGTLTGPLTVQGSTTLANLTVNGTFTVPGGFGPASISPAGSTAGQAIVSPGPAGPAAWGNVSAAALTGILPVVNGGTGVTTAAAELSRIGAAPLVGASFTGPVSLSYSGPIFTLNDTSGTSKASLLFNKNGVTAWGWGNSSTPNALAVDRYVSGSYADSPISVANATGIVTMSDGVAGTPISGSTGSFTTLSASGTVSGAGFTSLLSPYASLASPTFTGTPTVPNASAGTNTTQIASTAFVLGSLGAAPNGICNTTACPAAFTTISATGLISPTSTIGIKATSTNDIAQAGSVGDNPTNSTSGTSVSNNVNFNATSITNLPAGDWLVGCNVQAVAAASTLTANMVVGISTTSATLATLGGFLNGQQLNFATAAGFIPTLTTPVTRIRLATATTVYCVANIGFTTSTMTANGYIWATRPR